MQSNDKDFLFTPGIRIFNDRNEEDFACVDDNLFSGIS
jgi:hypothetical protein